MKVKHITVSAAEIAKLNQAYLTRTNLPLAEARFPVELGGAISAFSLDLDNRHLQPNSDEVFAHIQRFVSALKALENTFPEVHESTFKANVTTLEQALLTKDKNAILTALRPFNTGKTGFIADDICKLVESLLSPANSEVQWHNDLTADLTKVNQSVYDCSGENIFATLLGSASYAHLPELVEVVALANNPAAIGVTQRLKLAYKLGKVLTRLRRSISHGEFIYGFAPLGSRDPLLSAIETIINILIDKEQEGDALKAALLGAIKVLTDNTFGQTVNDLGRDGITILRKTEQSYQQQHLRLSEYARANPTLAIEELRHYLQQELNFTPAQADALRFTCHQGGYIAFMASLLQSVLQQLPGNNLHIAVGAREIRIIMNEDKQPDKISLCYSLTELNADPDAPDEVSMQRKALGVAILNIPISNLQYLEHNHSFVFPGSLSEISVDFEYYELDNTLKLLNIPSSVPVHDEEVEEPEPLGKYENVPTVVLLDKPPAILEQLENIPVITKLATEQPASALSDNKAADNRKHPLVEYLQNNAVDLAATILLIAAAVSLFVFFPQLTAIAIFLCCVAGITGIQAAVNLAVQLSEKKAITTAGSDQPMTPTSTATTANATPVAAQLPAEIVQITAANESSNDAAQKKAIVQSVTTIAKALTEEEKRQARAYLIDMVELFMRHLDSDKAEDKQEDVSELTIEDLNHLLAQYLSNITSENLVLIFNQLPPNNEAVQRFFVGQIRELAPEDLYLELRECLIKNGYGALFTDNEKHTSSDVEKIFSTPNKKLQNNNTASITQNHITKPNQINNGTSLLTPTS